VVWTVSEGAVCAALADVYMWKKDYGNAILWMNNLFKAKEPYRICLYRYNRSVSATYCNVENYFHGAGNKHRKYLESSLGLYEECLCMHDHFIYSEQQTNCT
jgi:hypothetical protein